MSRQAQKLRELIERPGATDGVGVWDAFSAKVAEQEGFEFLTILGSIVSWSLLGKTDTGYITQTEMLDVARRIVQAVDVPVIVDTDDGFGDPLMVRRTVQLFEQIGVAGVIIEDLKRPLRCSALGGGSMEPAVLMVQKIKAAVAARSDPNFVIFARTDDYEGIDEVISRVATYTKAGAEVGFVLGLKSVEDMERVGKASPIPLMAIEAPDTNMPLVPPDKLEAMGYKLHLYYPLFCHAARALRSFVKELKKDLGDRTKLPSTKGGLSPIEIENIMGLEKDSELQQKYLI